jgi:hypothetical protein
MRIILAVAVALAACPLAVSAAAASPPPGVAVSEVAPFHYAGAVSAPRSVRLATSNGDITATASTDGKLDVRAVVTDGDPSRVRVITREEAGGVAICVLFADESPDGCRLSGVSSSSGGRNHANEPSITLVARIPAGVSLAASAMNGAIHAHGMTAEVRATTLNGDVDVSAATVPEATTLNGNVTASFASAPRGKVELSTNNGNVKANLASGVDADIDAETSNGEIMVTFPMAIDAVPGGFGPKSGHARLGKGGARIDAHTTNGNVEIKTAG